MRSGNDNDPINLDNLHTRPHRRRREKRLMTMDEVNERFPLMKYKTWAASRARQGLPTSGGVSRPPSRTHAEIIPDECIESSPRTTETPVEQSNHTDSDIQANVSNDLPSIIISEKGNHEAIEVLEKNTHSQIVNEYNQPEKIPYIQPVVTSEAKKASVATEDEEDEEDDQIHIAVSPELLSSPGDSCAICIDTLEEEDEVRGLSCGHAFHASCIDPWLTSRRACCPLCKADFYIPKARSDAENVEGDRLNRRSDGPTMSQHPQSIWNSILTSTRLIRLRLNSNDQTVNQNISSNNNLPVNTTGQTITVTETSQPGRSGISSLSNTFRNISFPIFRLPGRNRNTADEPNNNLSTSPSQLEAGARR